MGSGGASSQTAAFAQTWGQFSSGSIAPANVTTWDNANGRPTRSMQYYTAGINCNADPAVANQSCATTAEQVVMNGYFWPLPPSLPTELVASNSAQCGAFASLLQSALILNGIVSTSIEVLPKNEASPLVDLVIQSWCFIGTSPCPQGPPAFPNNQPRIYQFILNYPGDPMVPPLPATAT